MTILSFGFFGISSKRIAGRSGENGGFFFLLSLFFFFLLGSSEGSKGGIGRGHNGEFTGEGSNLDPGFFCCFVKVIVVVDGSHLERIFFTIKKNIRIFPKLDA